MQSVVKGVGLLWRINAQNFLFQRVKIITVLCKLVEFIGSGLRSALPFLKLIVYPSDIRFVVDIRLLQLLKIPSVYSKRCLSVASTVLWQASRIISRVKPYPLIQRVIYSTSLAVGEALLPSSFMMA